MNQQSEKTEEVLKAAQSIIELLGVQASVQASVQDETIELSISTEYPALLIGYHGKNLSALQTVLGVIAYRLGGGKVLVDVDGWRERRDETVMQLASSAAQRAKDTKFPQPIYNLTSYERRIVHMALDQDPDIETESEGEGYERHLVVRVKPVNES